jgi:phage protein D
MPLTKPDYELTLSGNIVKKEYIKTITFNDEIENKSDEITVVTTREFPRPSFGDEVTLSLGYKDSGLVFVGKFFVQSSTISNQQLTFRATGADWTEEIKKRKNRKWENIDIGGIVSKIAEEHKLNHKCDKTHFVKHEAQAHESDMHFLHRLAQTLNASLSVKNATLLFLDKDAQKPQCVCDIKEAISSSIELVNKTLYKSCKCTYRDSKKNKDIIVTVGSGTPELEIKKSLDSFSKNDTPLKEQAKTYAQNQLNKANEGTVRGRVKIEGSTGPKAGGEIEIINSKYDDGVYKIKKVTHSLGSNGWVMDVSFER